MKTVKIDNSDIFLDAIESVKKVTRGSKTYVIIRTKSADSFQITFESSDEESADKMVEKIINER